MRAVAPVLAALSLATAGAAGPGAQNAAYWRIATLADLRFAHAVLREDHPGAAPELTDREFTDRLRVGLDAALAEGETVETRAAHDEVLARFMAGLGDAHLAFLPADAPLRPPTRIVRAEIDRDGGALVLRLPRLDPEAARTIDAFAASNEGEAPARPVAIDLRGNTGGNSAVGDRLVATLHGEQALRRFNQTLPTCPVLWRASPRNLAALEAIAAEAPKDRQAGLAAAAAALRHAQAQGRAFARPVAPQCRDPHKSPPQVDGAPGRAVSVWIDRNCFSSCLLLVDKLWRLGATLVGEPTATGNWYMEVRRTPLPSGLGAITVVQKVDLRRSKMMGPYFPARGGARRENRDG